MKPLLSRVQQTNELAGASVIPDLSYQEQFTITTKLIWTILGTGNYCISHHPVLQRTTHHVSIQFLISRLCHIRLTIMFELCPFSGSKLLFLFISYSIKEMKGFFFSSSSVKPELHFHSGHLLFYLFEYQGSAHLPFFEQNISFLEPTIPSKLRPSQSLQTYNCFYYHFIFPSIYYYLYGLRKFCQGQGTSENWNIENWWAQILSAELHWFDPN